MFSKSAHKQERKYVDTSEDRLSDSDDHYFQNKRSKYVPSSSESDNSDIDNSRNAKNHIIPNKKKTGHSRNEDRRSRSTSCDRERKKSRSHGHHYGSKNRRAYHHQSGNTDFKRHENCEEKHQHKSEHADHSENEKYSHKLEYHRKSSERDSRPPIRIRRDNYYKHRKFKRSRSRSFDHASIKWGKDDTNEEKLKKVEKEKPNFAFSGKLTEETNTYRGVVIKYSEPPEARKPKRRWRLYPFKGEKALQTLYIHRESGYLIGRDRKVVDIPIDHPSCSKQHAALQYRLVAFTKEDGTAGKRVRPYLIDLDSANGTYINNKRIEPRKYVELLEKDVIKFGYSSREYVLLHENSKDEAQDDDVKDEVIIKEEQ